MVFNETGRRGSDKEMVLVNPKVVSTNKQQEDMEEGCLSFPRLFADVEVRILCRGRYCLLPYQFIRNGIGKCFAFCTTRLLMHDNCSMQRPTQVKVKAQALDGSKFSLTLTGFPARIFQHEYDHLQVASCLRCAVWLLSMFRRYLCFMHFWLAMSEAAFGAQGRHAWQQMLLVLKLICYSPWGRASANRKVQYSTLCGVMCSIVCIMCSPGHDFPDDLTGSAHLTVCRASCFMTGCSSRHWSP